MKKLVLNIYINLLLAALFTVFCVSFSWDVSLLAFPLSLLFLLLLAFVSVVKLLKRGGVKHISLVRRFFQYEPFVFISAFVLRRAGEKSVPYAIDLVQALLWVLVMISSFVILFLLSEKRVYSFSPEWKKAHDAMPPVHYTGVKKVGIEALEWVDALVQAVFTIVLLNIFIFQLYEIPSESMVPTFLIKDRVVVFKTLSGPKFPLSAVGLPYLQSYERGDIVVFRNPHYKNDRKSEVKTFLSQFIYMISLTFIKTNTDENGQLKADPLVKRVIGLPGEQLMLMDGNLYIRTKDSPEFSIAEEDGTWATWNLNALPKKEREKVQRFVLTEEQYENTLFVEEARRNLDFTSVALECEAIAKEFSTLCTGAMGTAPTELLKKNELYAYNLFLSVNDLSVKLLSADGGALWFDSFMNEWHRNGFDLSKKTLVGGSMYSDARFRLNLMAKLVFGRLVLQNARLIKSDTPVSEWLEDEKRSEAFEKARLLYEYLMFMDQRNMGPFPSNAADGTALYIPENCYFMMGDNRYNSLDMRHSYETRLETLTDADPYSVSYLSNLEPQYVNRSMIQGKASLRIWPPSRFGIPGTKNARGN